LLQQQPHGAFSTMNANSKDSRIHFSKTAASHPMQRHRVALWQHDQHIRDAFSSEQLASLSLEFINLGHQIVNRDFQKFSETINTLELSDFSAQQFLIHTYLISYKGTFPTARAFILFLHETQTPH
jgi:hypothetical protein